MAKLRVYGLILTPTPEDRDVTDNARQVRAVVATTSQRRAAELLDTSLSYLRGYGGETWNDVEVAVATREPGRVFIRGADDHGGAYVERPPRRQR